MLEYDFTELDDDFITIWSKYMLTNDFMAIKNPLEKLAELGQVNAVSTYFQFLVQNSKSISNSKIDEIVESYEGANFNHLMAKANKAKFCMSEEVKTESEEIKKKFADYEDEVLSVDEKIEEYESALFFAPYTENAYNHYLGQKKDIIQKISDLTNRLYEINHYEKLRQQALDNALSEFKLTHNPLVYERYLELISVKISEVNHSVSCKSSVISDLRKSLLQHMKKGENVSTYEFSYGKNLAIFPYKSKDVVKGNEILSRLARRPFSKTLQDHIEKSKSGDKIK